MKKYRDILQAKVLNWLQTLKIPGSPCRYKLSPSSDDSIFSTCFALFILDLFKETDRFTDEERKYWISYIQSFQNKELGYFEPEQYYLKDKERNRFQLTCFCLSALDILGAKPRYSLKFIELWKTSDDIKEYLLEKGCHEGKGGSGNKAMFLAIFLTYEYERTKKRDLFEKINAWFEFHNETQNQNGFWGDDKSSLFYHGFQNGFHQLLIYFYWNRTVNRLNKIVDIILKIQDRDGFFAPTPGGGGCWDYDAIHILVNAYRLLNYKRNQIADSLIKAFHSIRINQKNVSGFCQSKQNPKNLVDLFKYLPFFLYGEIPYLWYYRIRKSLGSLFRKKNTIPTGWTKVGRNWKESNLWDTWLRCLTLAEISHTIELREQFKLYNVNFHKMIGLGWFAN